MRKELNNLVYVFVIIILSLVMLYWIYQKEGFHEDEIFSYGSSNYKYDNVFQRYSDKDVVNQIVFDEILTGNLGNSIGHIAYYLAHGNEFADKRQEMESKITPVWKSNEDARSYLTIQNGDVFGFFNVYYNQARDVHPPLFYLLVHFASCINFGVFSKYTIFGINLVFFILVCLELKKILVLLDKENLILPVLILYGLSIGTISTVIFLRMYQMLTFFVIVSLKIHLEVIHNEFEIDSKLKKQLVLTTILGFLTQYYFCIFAFLEFVIMTIIFLKSRKTTSLKKYIKCLLLSSVIGILLFPPSIYHIFFSYRGIGSSCVSNLCTRLYAYLLEICYAFSISKTFAIVILLVLFIVAIYVISKNKSCCNSLIFIVFPSVLFFFIICFIAPNMGNTTIIRYISVLMPIISLIFVYLFDELLKLIFKDCKVLTVIVLTAIVCSVSVYGLLNEKPRFLFTGYNELIDIAKENKGLNFVYICDNNFTYLSSLPEFLEYKKSMIINKSEDSVDILKNNSELKNSNEFILSISTYLDYMDLLKNILDCTEFTDYKVIAKSSEMERIIFKVYIEK